MVSRIPMIGGAISIRECRNEDNPECENAVKDGTP